MSDLYARLKAISAKPKEKAPVTKKSCAVIQRIFKLENAFALDPQELCALFALDDVAICDISSLLFLDTETTGLGGGAGTVAFLVGVGWIEGDHFILRQYWMRGYDEEADLVDKLEKHFENDPILISFNGKTFDVPLLKSRFIMQKKRMRELAHIDLLSHARRIFKLRLKHVNLTALEAALLGHEREADLPGSLVPQRYFDYLKNGDQTLLDPVFEHNAQDIYSLSKLLKLMATAYQSPESLAYAQDLYSVGRVYERVGQTDTAMRIYELAAPKSGQAAFALGKVYKKQHKMDQAVEIFLKAAETDVQANVELAKYYEHQKRDYDQALARTDRAIILESSPKKLLELFSRRARLIRKIRQKEKAQ